MTSLPPHVETEVRRILDAAARRIASESKGAAAVTRDDAESTTPVKDHHGFYR
jgi:hypothetical protein